MPPERVADMIQRCMDVYLHSEKSGNFNEGAILAAVDLLLHKASSSTALSEMGIPVWKVFVILGCACEKQPDSPKLNLAYSSIAFLLGIACVTVHDSCQWVCRGI